MAENVKLIPRCNDEYVVRLFERLSEAHGFAPFTFQIYGAHISIKKEENQKLLDKIIEKRGYSIRRAEASRRSDDPNSSQHTFSLVFERGQKEGGSIEPSLHTDSIIFSQIQHINPNTAIILNEIIEEIIVSNYLPKITGFDDGVLEELSRNHQQFLDNMRRQLSAVSDELTRARIEAEREVRERKDELDRAAGEEKAKLQAEHKERLIAIEVERTKLAEREKNLDDRNNTHARRDLQKILKDYFAEYKTKFELTKGTRKLRWPVILTVIIIEFICIFALTFSTPPWHSAELGDRVFFWLKSFGLTFLAAGTAVWFLRWLTQWSSRHADAEFQLRQLELDIGRASWVVETTLEWKANQDSTIPDSLLEAISRNLFVAGEARNDSADSPADHLASALLGDASKVKLKSGDHEIELDRAAIKRAKRPHDRD